MSNALNMSAPVRSKERIQAVDVLRGFAILGILLFNMKGFSGQASLASSWDQPLDRAIVILIDFFVQAKFYSLFSFLFGWGMAVQMRRAEEKGAKFFPVYLRRLLILLLFGTLHSIFLWTGDILLMYAIIGLMMLIIFRKSSPRTLLITAFLLLLSRIIFTLPGAEMGTVREWCVNVTRCWTPDTPLSPALYSTGSYWEVTRLRFQHTLNGIWWFPCYIGNVFAMMLLGLYTGKRRLFADLDQHQNLFRRVMWVGLVVGVILNGIFAYLAKDPISDEIRRLIAISARTFGAPALTLFYITGITRLFQKPRWQERLAPLALVGRMALTNYISHSLLLTFFFYGYGLGLYGEVDPTFGLILSLLLYRGQIQFSRWWFEHYRFGPLEWLWRTLTYNIQLPISMKRKLDSLAEAAAGSRKKRPYFTAALIAAAIPLVILIIYQLVDQARSLPPDENLLEELAEESSAGEDPSREEDPEEGYSPGFLSAIELNAAASPNIAALEEIALSFEGDAALELAETLSSDIYQGRYSGTLGSQAAAELIATKFSDYGLSPVGDDGSYAQKFLLDNLVLDAVPQLRISIPGGLIQSKYRLHEDLVPLLGGYAGANRGEGEVVWGVNCSPRDFHELDVVGKIVFCRYDDPQDQARQAAKNGAAGLLLYANREDQPPAARASLQQAWIPDPIPVFRVYDRPAAALLEGTGHSISDLTILYEPLNLEARVEMEVEASPPCPGGSCSGQNLLGFLPGWDPDYVEQVIVISANYDGLGSTPDGGVWPGANWNSSGIGALLEIARAWHEIDYRPRTSVLFAAWDGQEQGDLGIRHFIDNSIFPLENTVAFIHLDGVGYGEGFLEIKGGSLTGQVETAAAEFGVETVRSEAPIFLNDWFPDASNMIVELSLAGGDLHKGLPSDTADTLQANRFEEAGRVAGLVAVQLADVPGAIQDLLSQRCGAILKDDLSAFLGTVATTSIKAERTWFDQIQDLDPEGCEAEAANLHTIGETIHANVEYRISYPAARLDDDVTLTVRMPARAELSPNGWKWAGPDLVAEELLEVGSSRVAVFRPALSSDDYSGIGDSVLQEYQRISSILSLSPDLDAEVLIYSNREAMIADIDPTSSSRPTEWVGKNRLKFSSNPGGDDDRLRFAVTNLLLENAGIPQGRFPWLWQGLPMILEPAGEQILVQSDRLNIFHIQLRDNSAVRVDLNDWAALAYLQQTQGWSAIGALITDLGEACQLVDCKKPSGADQALRTAVGMDQDGFQSAWEAYWLDLLDQTQADINQVLEMRTAAVLNGEQDAFLDTVDAEILHLINEERDWFLDLAGRSLDTFQLTGIPLALYVDGSVLVRVTIQFRLADASGAGSRGSLPVEILFTPAEGELRWAGPAHETLEAGRITVRFPQGYQEQAAIVLESADTIYSLLAEAMLISNPPPVNIRLYADNTLFRTSVALTYTAPEWAPGWSAVGHSIKLGIEEGNENVVDPDALVRHLSRYLLSMIGVDHEWLLSGGSTYLARKGAGELLENEITSSLLLLNSYIRHQQDFSLEDFPPPDELDENDYWVALAQAWDALNYLAENYGEQTLLQLLKGYKDSTDLDQAVSAATGLSTAEFAAAWKESFSQGHIQPGTLETSQAFDPARAVDHINILTAPEMAGRQAGTEGSELAANYIARKFAEFGLIVEEQIIEIPFRTYLEKPELLLQIGGSSEEFIYREDFLVLDTGWIPEGLSGELVWVSDREYGGMELNGKIAVRKPTLAIREEINYAQESGASALILVGGKNRQEDLLARYPLPASSQVTTFPVLELTKSGFNRLLELTGQNQGTLASQYAAVLMGAEASLTIQVTPPEMRETSNVIGILPGVNPELQDQVVILGAHYDHVGDEFGVRYSGVNDNASGVSILLEIARTWQQAGYKPERTVVLIAWGAQESGELGSRHYLANPLFPLENTVASLQLDAVGGGDGFYLEATGLREEDGWLLFSAQTAGELADTRLITTGRMDTRAPDPDWLYSPGYLFDYYGISATSDDLPFREMGIPTLLLRWKEISEANLPDELSDEILEGRLETSGITICTAAMILAR